MANNYMQFCFELKCPGEDFPGFTTRVVDALDRLKSAQEDDEGFSGDCSVVTEGQRLYVEGEESGDTELAIKLIEAYLELPGCPVDRVGFTYSNTCSAMRPDEFSGGAIIVRRGEPVRYVDALEWLTRELG